MPIPDLPLFKHRDTVVTPADQNQFVTQFENTMDTMSNDVIPALNLSINDMNTQYNNIYNNLPFAPDSGYSQAYIDTNIYKKTEVDTAINNSSQINTLPDKPTPDDTDNLALQEVGGLLKKLSFVNLKLWILSLFSPTMTGAATLNGTTNNTVVLTDIVTKLNLEIGDVIRIEYAGYNKLHTVETITDDNSIIVNYEHAGNRGNGSLKLPNATASVTITRIAKWYNASSHLGRAYVNVTTSIQNNTNRVNTSGRAMDVIVSGARNTVTGTFLYINSIVIAEWTGIAEPDELSATFQVNNGEYYKIVNLPQANFYVMELR